MSVIQAIDLDTTKVYILAVSGGVDSTVLLHLCRNYSNIIVAHFDHGIRSDSDKDRIFVEKLADSYGLRFEFAEGKLGSKASEAAARKARYDYLLKLKNKHNAAGIITAHHQDDVLETMIINILRGTGRKGLSSLQSHAELIRPLLSYSKEQILAYAESHALTWREDHTNQDTNILRNYVRHVVLPRLPSQAQKSLIRQYVTAKPLNLEADRLRSEILSKVSEVEGEDIVIPRTVITKLESGVAKELLIETLDRLSETIEIDRKQIGKIWLFCKTAKVGKQLKLGKKSGVVVRDGGKLHFS